METLCPRRSGFNLGKGKVMAGVSSGGSCMSTYLSKWVGPGGIRIRKMMAPGIGILPKLSKTIFCWVEKRNSHMKRFKRSLSLGVSSIMPMTWFTTLFKTGSSLWIENFARKTLGVSSAKLITSSLTSIELCDTFYLTLLGSWYKSFSKKAPPNISLKSLWFLMIGAITCLW